MSILIKGMEMPKDCISCPFCDYEQGLCLAANDMDTAPRTIGKRHDDCPLVPVPPHGRLIDADALLKRNCMNLMFENPQERYESCDECLKDRGHCGLEIDAVNIVNAPTVIEAKDKDYGKAEDTDSHRAAKARAAIHAKWKIVVPTPQSLVYAICSNCGKATAMRPEIKNRCPNCGARMDGGDTDG